LNQTPTTELEAVNQMLAGIGESPISNLANSGIADAAIARQTLRNVSREVQSKGWHWNTDRGRTLTPSIPDGFLLVPLNTMKADTVGIDARVNVVLRGSKLYDVEKHTYTFTEPVKVDIVSFLAFDELPEPARNLITLRAVRRFQMNSVGSTELETPQRRDEIMAMADLMHDEAESADYNLLDHYPVAGVLNR
jgi:hypothetical protein